MRSNALVLAVSLLVTDHVLGGPCKPQGSTLGEVSISHGIATATVLESTTLVLSETTINPEATTTTTTSMVVDTTTLLPNAEPSTTVATTTTAPTPLGTFALTGAGGLVSNAQIQSNGEARGSLVFNSNSPGVESRQFTLDTATGRLQDTTTGDYICAYYRQADQPSVPVDITNCDPTHLGPHKLYNYLDCRVVGNKLSCTAPSASYYINEDFTEWICTPAPENEANNQFFYQNRGDTASWAISRGSPANYIAIDVLVSAV